MIRRAEIEDASAIVSVGARFYAYSPWARYAAFDEESTRKTVSFLIGSSDGVVFLSDKGIIGGLIYPLYFNSNFRIAQELFWYSEDKTGRLLREAFEEWARSKDASAIQFSCLADGKEELMRKHYARHGYRATETALLREL